MPARVSEDGAGGGPLSVHHFGPDTAYTGGMATVLMLFREQRIGADSVELHSTWVPDSRMRTAMLTWDALKVVRGLSAGTVVHVHLSTRGSLLRKGTILAYAARRGLPRVISMHGADFVESVDRYRGLATRVLRLANAITALSEDVEAEARRLAPGVLVRAVPNPVMVDEFVAPVTQAGSTALFAGEIGLRKGADVLTRAWPTVHDALPLAQCIVIGPKGDFAMSDGDGLRVLPPQPPEAIRAMLRDARVAVLPSRAEGMPMFLLEAMATGRPFVSTPVGAIPGLAASGGLLAAVGDHEQLAAALIRLLDDPVLAQRLGDSGREFCLATRSPAVVSAAYREIYREASLAAQAR
jgi:glycosyltransferase involved in cell wall biosynthesis